MQDTRKHVYPLRSLAPYAGCEGWMHEGCDDVNFVVDTRTAPLSSRTIFGSFAANSRAQRFAVLCSLTLSA
jgi:hypothetical protein